MPEDRPFGVFPTVPVETPGDPLSSFLTASVGRKNRTALYVEVPPQPKQAMERLAEQHHRSLAGECITALEQYVQREQQRAKEEGKK